MVSLLHACIWRCADPGLLFWQLCCHGLCEETGAYCCSMPVVATRRMVPKECS